MRRTTKSVARFCLLLFFVVQIVSAQDNYDVSGKVKELQTVVSDIRGLEFRIPVKAGIYSKKELGDFLVREISKEVPNDRAETYQKIAVKFGFIPKELDLMKTMIELLTSQIAGFYNPKAKELYIIKPGDSDDEDKTLKAQRDMLKQLYGINMDDMVMAHELTHALQDQVLGLSSLPIDSEGNDDMVLAIKGLVEGDATIVMAEYMFKDKFDSAKYMFGGMMKEGTKTGKMAEMPAYLTHPLVFPYSDGYDFVLKVKENRKDGKGAESPADPSEAPPLLGGGGKDGGWGTVTNLYKDPPLSTEQILHPKKYYEERDYPTAVILPDLAKYLSSDWRLLESNVWGEFVTKIMLDEFKVKRTNRATAGWDGDRYAALENKKDSRIAAVWFTTWDTEKDAVEFFTAYVQLLKAKYGTAKLPDDSGDKSALLQFEDADGSIVSLERRDKDVLIVEGIPKENFDDIKNILWKETKKEEVRKVERVKERILY